MAVTVKEELKVDTELADDVDQSQWTFQYSWDQGKNSFVTAKGHPVSKDEGFKTPKINLCSFERPHMRGFHYAWLSFFMAFVCWFAFAPMMIYVREDLSLSPTQVLDVNIASVFSTVAARFIMGPLCEQLGPKRCQFMLLAWISFMVFMAPTVSNFATLALVRFLIGFGGATFVVTQYWSSMLFTKDVVGLANACTAGWGNLGGGVTNNIMSGFFVMFNEGFGFSQEKSWRCAFIPPAIIVGVFAIILRTTSDDSPQGDYVPLMKAGIIPKKTAAKSARDGFTNLNSWVLGVQYAACFGVELHVNNTAALYFKDNFPVGPTTAASLASVFGWMNLFCRSLGGAASDYGNQVAGMRGRLVAQTLGLLGEGALLVVFSRQTTIPTAMVCLVLFSSFVQAVEGMSFGIVPYVDPKNTGAVCAVVGAWGNIGAVMWGYLFREGYATNFADGYLALGFIIMCTAPFSALVKIPGHTSLFSGEEYKGYCTEEFIGKQDKRIEALEEIVSKHEEALKQREA